MTVRRQGGLRLSPCDIATLATDAPGAGRFSNTIAFNFALRRRRKTTQAARRQSTIFSLAARQAGMKPPTKPMNSANRSDCSAISPVSRN